MTVINLGNTDGMGYPRGQEIVSTPEVLIGSSNKDVIHTDFPLYKTGLGESDVTRAAYAQWKQEHGIAGLTIGNTTLSNTQIIVTLAGAAAGFYLGKRYLKQQPMLAALIGAVLAYFASKRMPTL